jgi:hypothetical protein
MECTAEEVVKSTQPEVCIDSVLDFDHKNETGIVTLAEGRTLLVKGRGMLRVHI